MCSVVSTTLKEKKKEKMDKEGQKGKICSEGNHEKGNKVSRHMFNSNFH
jgi:hypothetical protein